MTEFLSTWDDEDLEPAIFEAEQSFVIVENALTGRVFFDTPDARFDGQQLLWSMQAPGPPGPPGPDNPDGSPRGGGPGRSKGRFRSVSPVQKPRREPRDRRIQTLERLEEKYSAPIPEVVVDEPTIRRRAVEVSRDLETLSTLQPVLPDENEGQRRAQELRERAADLKARMERRRREEELLLTQLFEVIKNPLRRNLVGNGRKPPS